MLVDTFANRLQIAMNRKGLKQSELAEKTKLDKSLISNYLSGNYNAKQDKLSILANVLDVTETWLMGYDVPMEQELNSKQIELQLNFGLTLFELLRYYKISKEELSQRLNINLDIITKALKGTELPTDQDIEKIANYFGIKNTNDLFDETTFNKLIECYTEADKIPEDKYKFGFALESMFEKISEEINRPLDELKKIFLNKNNKNINTDLALTYDNLKNFFLNYFDVHNNNHIANILYNKVKVLPEDKQKMILNVTEAVMKEIDDQLDNK